MKRIYLFLVLVASSLTMMAADIMVTTVANASTGSFREAVATASSGDVIKFNVTDGDKIELISTIAFAGADKVFVVEGLNQATGKPMVISKSPDAAVSARLIDIANGAGSAGLDVTIRNISFEDVSAGDAAKTVNGSVISAGNSAYDPSKTGPDIGKKFKVTVDGCQFINIFNYQAAGSGGGAAIFVSHGLNLFIKNCLFSNNKALLTGAPDVSKSFGGGAISSTGTNTASISVINSTFYGCVSDARGGAIYIGHPTDLVNCTFVGNISQRGGGLYTHTDSPFNIINCIFTYNYALSAANSTSADIDRSKGTFPVFSNNIVGISNLAGTITSGNNNVVFTDGMPLFASYTTDEASNKVPVLANNGGFYKTVALTSGGIGSGEGAASVPGFNIPTTDQRGYSRKASPSIGAYEFDGVLTNTVQNFTPGGINPIAKQIFFAAVLNGSAKVYNLAGTCVYQTEVNGGGLTPAFKEGVYIVKLVNQNGLNIISKVVLR